MDLEKESSKKLKRVLNMALTLKQGVGEAYEDFDRRTCNAFRAVENALFEDGPSAKTVAALLNALIKYHPPGQHTTEKVFLLLVRCAERKLFTREQFDQVYSLGRDWPDWHLRRKECIDRMESFYPEILEGRRKEAERIVYERSKAVGFSTLPLHPRYQEAWGAVLAQGGDLFVAITRI